MRKWLSILLALWLLVLPAALAEEEAASLAQYGSEPTVFTPGLTISLTSEEPYRLEGGFGSAELTVFLLLDSMGAGMDMAVDISLPTYLSCEGNVEYVFYGSRTELNRVLVLSYDTETQQGGFTVWEGLTLEDVPGALALMDRPCVGNDTELVLKVLLMVQEALAEHA